MTISSIRRATPLVGVASLALVLAACGGDDTTDTTTDATTDPGTEGTTAGGDLSGQLSGAGASSQAAAMQAWQAGIQAINPDLTVNYDPVGSGGGREQFTAGGVAFAGSDAALDEEETAAANETCGGGFIQLPNYISPIAVAFNLPGIDSLDMTPELIADIFNQQVTTWDDPAIAELNPDVELPSTSITPVNRSDESGTTENFVEYLFAAAPDNWPYEPDGNWPVPGGEAAQGNSGVVQATAAGEGSIVYADASQIGDLGTVAVGVGDQFVPFSTEAAAAVVNASGPAEGADPATGNLAIDLERDTSESGVYPIVLVSYHLACQSYDDPQTAANVKGFLEYVISEEGQLAAAEAAGSAPITEESRAAHQSAIDLIQTG
ncbi:MAG: phosphate ABC transporter substrate-binding protein PstS [Jiangellales bacterium]